MTRYLIQDGYMDLVISSGGFQYSGFNIKMHHKVDFIKIKSL